MKPKNTSTLPDEIARLTMMLPGLIKKRDEADDRYNEASKDLATIRRRLDSALLLWAETMGAEEVR